MSCTIEIKEPLQPGLMERTCNTCKFKVTNQFLSKCPRCTAKLELASLCMGCMQNAACHGTDTKTVKKQVNEKKNYFNFSFFK